MVGRAAGARAPARARSRRPGAARRARSCWPASRGSARRRCSTRWPPRPSAAAASRCGAAASRRAAPYGVWRPIVRSLARSSPASRTRRSAPLLGGAGERGRRGGPAAALRRGRGPAGRRGGRPAAAGRARRPALGRRLVAAAARPRRRRRAERAAAGRRLHAGRGPLRRPCARSRGPVGGADGAGRARRPRPCARCCRPRCPPRRRGRHKRTAGNPFYVAELVRPTWPRAAIGDDTGTLVPTRVREVVRAARRAARGRGLRRCSRSAPSPGASRSPTSCAPRACPAPTAAEALDRGTRPGLVVADAQAPGHFTFAHGIVRDADPRGAARAAARRALHEAVAAALRRAPRRGRRRPRRADRPPRARRRARRRRPAARLGGGARGRARGGGRARPRRGGRATTPRRSRRSRSAPRRRPPSAATTLLAAGRGDVRRRRHRGGPPALLAGRGRRAPRRRRRRRWRAAALGFAQVRPYGAVDEESVTLLSQALERLADGPLRVRVTGLLAVFEPEQERREALIDEALGGRRPTRPRAAWLYPAAVIVNWRPERAAQRAEAAEEVVRAAVQHADHGALVWAYLHRDPRRDAGRRRRARRRRPRPRARRSPTRPAARFYALDDDGGRGGAARRSPGASTRPTG